MTANPFTQTSLAGGPALPQLRILAAFVAAEAFGAVAGVAAGIVVVNREH